MASNGMLANKRASKAVALQCPDPISTPSVVIGGGGAVARAIIESATELGIPITQQIELTNQLAVLPPASAVPEDSLVLMAEVLAFLFDCDQSLQEER